MAGMDKAMMEKALMLAEQAGQRDEVPVGALVCRGGEIIGWGSNRREETGLPTRHAEIEAMEMACRYLGHWRLDECTLYVTKEPCVMCAGSLVLARLGRLVYGCRDPRYGCAGSVLSLPDDPRFNHRVRIEAGLLEERCSAQLSQWFQERRLRKKHLQDEAEPVK